MITHNLGFPRIGKQRELKFALEKYWKNEISISELLHTGEKIRKANWQMQREADIQLIPVNDFSFYDHVLDTSMMLGNIPPRFSPLLTSCQENPYDLYFAMARGYQQQHLDIPAMEMTKWFNTNYHYIVPEFYADTTYQFFYDKILKEFDEAKNQGIEPKPVLLGPVSYILLGKIKDSHINVETILHQILPIYKQVLKILEDKGCHWIQIDEPILATDLLPGQSQLFDIAYPFLTKELQSLSVLVATYFGEVIHNLPIINKLPITALHVDLVAAPFQLDTLLQQLSPEIKLSLGVIDGRNIWKNNFEQTLKIINKAASSRGEDMVMIAPSCSLLHVPYDLDMENNPSALPPFVKYWMAFAKQKIHEIKVIEALRSVEKIENSWAFAEFSENTKYINDRKSSKHIKNDNVSKRLRSIEGQLAGRKSPFDKRYALQQKFLNLPLLPTTTIGSFPQTAEIRKIRNQFRKGQISETQYKRHLHTEIEKCIRLQEELEIDVLVHGEFERNDMVEYFGEQLEGFAFTENGWVQSYGSRCVKPPIIYGDVSRPAPMTLEWSCFAQSLTKKPVKGMLTGPLTILKWSFVRDDQPWHETLMQIALALNDEVIDLQRNNINVIQIDEPALRESLPLRKKDWENHLNWAIKAFHHTVANIDDETQIHTHMCYSEFNDIIEYIARLDADVITIEASRSDMELLQAFHRFKYPNAIGPGIYDIHSPRIPSVEEMELLIRKALEVIPAEQLWINPDCGLKTRDWPETLSALKNMVQAAKQVRKSITVKA